MAHGWKQDHMIRFKWINAACEFAVGRADVGSADLSTTDYLRSSELRLGSG
jgi:hypothetical protein